MDHAWLDSLSEDWVSQPGSDVSAGQLPPLHTENSHRKQRSLSTRISRGALGDNSPLRDSHDSSINILSERSTNEIIRSQKRKPSKLSSVKSLPSRTTSRSLSASTTASVVHNTVEHQISPGKDNGGTPEWKRRLVYGEVQYGEQRDLFCSAAVGLQDMFKPPPPPKEAHDGESYVEDITMPSSPPGYPRRTIPTIEEVEESGDDIDPHPNDVSPSPSPRRTKKGITFKLNESSPIPRHASQAGPQMNATPNPKHNGRIYRDESCLSSVDDTLDQSRKISGQSDTRNEDFSPILIGKHSDEAGRVDFALIEMPADQLKQKLERLRISQMLLNSQEDPEAKFDETDAKNSAKFETTEDFARHGGYLNFQRGGRSEEGSFRHRALSSGFGGDTSEMLPEESLQASTPKQFPTMRTDFFNVYSDGQSTLSPTMPRAPFPSPQKRDRNAQSGGSPLKLFGPYDTFTNQTLLRRISQFEEGSSGQQSRLSIGAVTEEGELPNQINRAFVASPRKSDDADGSHSVQGSKSFSRFGAGELEGFQFDSDGDSFQASERATAYPLARDHSPDEESELMVRRSRNKPVSPSTSQNAGLNMLSKYGEQSPGSPIKDGSGTPRRDCGSESKRPRTSPSKDPTPKRRRTLHRSDIAYGREHEIAVVDSAHHKVDPLMGKKRKDARPGAFELADPNILATRSILRPRTPTPSQRSSQLREDHPFADPEGPVDQAVPGDLEDGSRAAPGPALLPPHLSNVASLETERKPSIRTQDFVDQAAQIMAMIRSQVKPNGLASLEESEAENGGFSPEDDGSYQESTNERLSRPPSREGKATSVPTQQAPDSDLAKRLKKYQEMSDMGDLISSSMRSMSLAQEAIRAAQEVERQIENGRSRQEGPLVPGEDFISDIPNVRLSMNPSGTGLRRAASHEFPSNSSGGSTNRTYPTGSSRGSDSRKVIMPDSVSHLIPDKVGSMFLDKNNNIWIKKKESQPAPDVNPLPSEDSEDDPFASIPDLSVDMTKEMHNLRLATIQREANRNDPLDTGSPASPTREGGPSPSRGYVTLSPDQALAVGNGVSLEKVLNGQEEEGFASEINPSKHDINIHAQGPPRRRNMTIAFSSPIASFMQAGDDERDIDDDSAERSPVEHGQRPAVSSARPSSGPRSVLKPSGGNLRSGLRPASAHSSAAFIPRPVSRIDEQDEDSTVEIPLDEQRQVSLLGEASLAGHKTPSHPASLSFVLDRTPGYDGMPLRAEDSALIGLNVGRLSLSPLSEFTLNNSDPSFGLEVSYVMGHRHMVTGDGSKQVMSMTIRDLVDKLSEAEPFEPYWEDMAVLDLADKKLASLHMLDEFCGKLVTLDASKNALLHLEGIPSGIRELKVTQNRLTELTSWDHLMNLQYVDVSGNDLSSLSALKNLVHLRSVKADNNQLRSLDGLDGHDGLLTLRARDNLIEQVDFACVDLPRLTELDLGGNQITSVTNLQLLPALARLKLPRNRLRTFAASEVLMSLRQLDVSDNRLQSLDVSAWPSLHSLYADRNELSRLEGFARARRLDSLSLREQNGVEGLCMDFLSSAYEIRKLFLSGNVLGTFDPPVDLLNLQLLELANCGLESLPRRVGQLMPNLRTLNINFNAISDLSPLRFIPRMKKLLASGNRLADSTQVTELLTDFPHLTQLDLRDNPVTLGFYAPVQVLMSTNRTDYVDPFKLPDGDAERDAAFSSRLDEATAMRRRLHHFAFIASCKRLRRLDGLAVSRRTLLAQDALFQTLLAEGLLSEGEAGVVAGDGDGAERKVLAEIPTNEGGGGLKSSQWNAEDSFA